MIVRISIVRIVVDKDEDEDHDDVLTLSWTLKSICGKYSSNVLTLFLTLMSLYWYTR